MKNIIPLSRGLGSSSSAIVTGLIAANILSDNRLNNNDILNLANEIEGHPDNVAPAIFGGITISYVKDDVAFCKKFLPAKKLRFIAVVPDEPLSTHKARAAIPKIIPHSDAVYNASRTALYVAALLTGDYSKLHDALDDKLHQPYRLPLIRGANDVLKAATTNGAYGAIISGAGSTLMAYADENSDCHKIGKAMVEAFSNNGQHSVYHILELDDLGAREKI